ncbi:hypothetical protein [Microbacterium aurantiacum]|uniref:hypothetical protein n=1 Tax=Microbacterium aurantiacum TaxID=162393 RepID=UPI00343FDDB5
MWESLTGFVVIGVAIVVGWIIGRNDLLGEHARPVLARLTFFVLSPFLLFVVLAQADVRTLFSALLPVSLVAALAVITLHAVVARDTATSARSSWRRTFVRAITNPLVLGSALGASVSVSGVPLPPVVLEPAVLIANACVPVLRISCGISLHGQRVLGARGHRRDVILASGLKLLVMPAAAWAVADFVFGLSAQDVLAVTLLLG